MNLLRKIQYNQYWNIGICEQTPEELVSDKSLKPVSWLKHHYRDRWFADPFILGVTKEEITVLVEERMIVGDKGYLSELVVERKTNKIKKRYVILEIDSHLSYPAIYRKDGHIYVYPENALGGPLKMYEYDAATHRLTNPKIVLDERVADSTILESEGRFYLIATKYPESQEKAYLFISDRFDGPYEQLGEEPVQWSRSCSRPGGNWFIINNSIYRPAQNCEKRYGSALKLMCVDNLDPFQEHEVFTVLPLNYKYNLGVHTINFLDGVAVIDGYGYICPLMGRLYYNLRSLMGKRN